MQDSICLLKSLKIFDPLDIGSTHSVKVTHVNNPGSFYVRLIKTDVVLRENNIPLASLEAPTGNNFPWQIELGQVVTYSSPLLKKFVRGQIFFIQEDKNEKFCDLLAIDYGCFEKSIPQSRMRKQLIISDTPPLAIHCKLADCQPLEDDWSEKVIDCMKHFINYTEFCDMKIRGKTTEVITVELSNNTVDISTMLAYMGYTCLYTNNSVSRFVTTHTPAALYYKYKEFVVGDNMSVRFQYGSTLEEFYVATVEDHNTYINERPGFIESCRLEKPIRPEDIKIGLPVAVEMEIYRLYERAFIKEIIIPNKIARVQLVDWGRTLEMDFSKIRPISDFFLCRPVVAIYCTVVESQMCNSSFQNCKYPGSQFNINIKQVGYRFDTPYLIEITTKN